MAESFTDVSNAPWFKQRHNEGFVPQKVEDFGDGVPFLRFTLLSFLLTWVLLSVKENVGDDEEEEEEELLREIEETTKETKASLQKILNRRFTTTRRHSSKFIKYKPSQQSASAAFNSGAKERIINIFEMLADPLDPPKFKHKRLPKPSASASPPVPIMHSPPRLKRHAAYFSAHDFVDEFKLLWLDTIKVSAKRNGFETVLQTTKSLSLGMIEDIAIEEGFTQGVNKLGFEAPRSSVCWEILQIMEDVEWRCGISFKPTT
uniref:SKI-interacting protein SKIP SNW domain-containing protein n=1 Tax=Quercus lobata TaxID=97700 RepID=A0A7N2KLT6_QUELO